LLGEFQLIARYFAPLAAGEPAALGLTDDAAVLAPPPGREIVLTADAMVAGVHFLPSDPADQVAQKLLRVNLSDLAAMGARPLGYLLTCCWPKDTEEAWVAAFAAGLLADQRVFGIRVLGGDMTSTPGPLTFSLTALGHVAPGRALRRSTARAGDLVCVSGSIGDGALGLGVLTREWVGLPEAVADFLAERYRRPRPRLALGQALAESGLATACLDISDGLVADLGHIGETSGLGAEIAAARVPLSDSARTLLADDLELFSRVLTGGDDYELCFTLAPDRAGELPALAAALELPLTVIGRMTAGAGVRVLDRDGQALALGRGGWTHF
jgi:thiamine-monophosphate kinase